MLWMNVTTVSTHGMYLEVMFCYWLFLISFLAFKITIISWCLLLIVTCSTM